MSSGWRQRGGGHWQSRQLSHARPEWFLTFKCTARIRRRWGEKATVGAVEQSPQHVQKAGELQIIYLPQGHTLTPVRVFSVA